MFLSARGRYWLSRPKLFRMGTGLRRVALKGSFRGPRFLSLDHSEITDAGLAHLSGLDNLSILFIESAKVTDAGLLHSKGPTNRRHLASRTGSEVDALGNGNVSRFSIAAFMTVVLYLAMCLAALRSDDPRLGSATVYSVTAGFVALSALIALARQDRYRMLRVGFALFAWVYLVLGFGSFFSDRASRMAAGAECGITIFCGFIGAGLGWLVDSRDAGVARTSADQRTPNHGYMNKFTVCATIVAIVYVALCFATLRFDNSVFTSQGVYGLTIFLLLTATTMAVARSKPEPLRWTGFAVFGWSYLLLAFDELARSVPARPRPITMGMIHYLWLLCDRWINPGFLSRATFTFLAHSVLTVVFGLVGALIGESLSRERDLRTNARDGNGRTG